jgi:subtilisin
MSDTHTHVSRRNVLKSTGAALAAGGLTTGLAAGKRGESVEVNVGWASASGRDAARGRALEVRREFAFDAMTMRTSQKHADELAARDDIRYVEENGEIFALAQSLPWGIDRTDSGVAHANGSTGAGADIAILDTGIDSDHPDLVDNLGSGTAFVSSRGKYAEDWDDDHDHGTHCAGIANAVNNSQGVVGVSTEATLHAVKVLDKRGSGSFSDIAAGMEYTADQGWDVGSMSLGASSGSQVIQDACTYAYSNGVLLVAAAGNSGPCTDCVGYPAVYPEVIAVSATSSDDSLASFSSTGPEVEIAAPGEAIYSSIPGGYDTFSGTSMACPHVAGAAGQLMAAGYTNTEARDQLTATAEDLGLSATDQGAGLLDVAAALGYDSSDDL